MRGWVFSLVLGFFVNCSFAIAIHPKLEQVEDGIKHELQKVTPTKKSVLQERINKSRQIDNNPFGIVFFKPSYILPYYYTSSPYTSIYQNITPDHQKLDNNEFKVQFSFELPIWRNLFNQSNLGLYAAYTQLSYWQVYAKSQYFRETNYMPEIFIRDNFMPNWVLETGAVHQSNGRGGDLERSWNRAYVDVKFSSGNWLMSVKPWILIFKNQSSNLHNPDIAKYLGYERVLFAYKLPWQMVLSLKIANLEHGWDRISTEGAISFPLTKKIHGYIQLFHGYGQSLIEYNHKTNSIGIGISLNNWI
ncbi:MAG: phospholipase A [Legionellales bacterium]|nr:phospholipase A [Legionellales bacterium]